MFLLGGAFAMGIRAELFEPVYNDYNSIKIYVSSC
jgi:hypothetical protein